jgi:hypothetical protein
MSNRLPHGGETRRPEKRILILGTDALARDLARRLARHGDPRIRVLGHVHAGDAGPEAVGGAPVLPLTELADTLRRPRIDEVIAASPGWAPAVEACTEAGVPLTFGSDLPRSGPSEKDGAEPGGAPGPLAVHLVLKRALDIGVAALGLVLAAPVLGLAALAVQTGSPGPVLSRQTRCGRTGRPFTLYRLRTGVRRSGQPPGARVPQSAVVRAVRDSGIDDLPQLWNVLIGDMSLGGPRPPLPLELARLGGSGTRRLAMRPGLT